MFALPVTLAGMCGPFAMDPVLIVRERADPGTGELRRTVDEAVWDFRPAFMRDSKRPNFNARIETVASNGLLKGAFASARALVPMRGYYEWTGELNDGLWQHLVVPHLQPRVLVITDRRRIDHESNIRSISC
ncbi:hypothetical protein GCM10027414_14550 [Humibacter ginsengiterrae]